MASRGKRKKLHHRIGLFMRRESNYVLDRLGIWIKELEYRIEGKIQPLLKAFDDMGIVPNTLTATHFFLGIAAAYFLLAGQHGLFVTFLLLSTFVDMFDGMLARYTNKTSGWGAGFDLLADLTVGVAVMAALGTATGLILESLVALATMFYQEWVYILILTIGYSRVPLHSFRPSYALAIFGFYAGAIYLNIALNLLSSLLGLVFFFQVGWRMRKERKQQKRKKRKR